jgi:hypothetical protein
METIKNWARNLSSEDAARYVRVAAQFMAGSGVGVGVLTGDKWIALGGAVISVVSFIFTLRGNTVAAKVAEVEKSPEIAKVVPTADATPAVKDAASAAPVG